MKSLVPLLLMILSVGGCGGRDDRPAPAPAAPISAPPVAAATPQTQPPSQRISPAEWLAQPIFKKPNPYDLPLEYDLDLPDLPPKKLMEPSGALPGEEEES